jgi:hypothetical protein
MTEIDVVKPGSTNLPLHWGEAFAGGTGYGCLLIDGSTAAVSKWRTYRFTVFR